MEKPEDDDSFASSSVDRISELPQPILHHILSFLPRNEAAQTCVLSKLWHHVWCTRPVLKFRGNFFRRRKKTIKKILGHTLRRYCNQNLSIKRLVVEISSIEHAKKLRLLDKWIPKVLMNLGVETFHLMLPNFQYYALPWTCLIFQAEFLKELYLRGCKIESIDAANLCLKHLKTLSLNHVYIEDDRTLEKIMESCPLIESLNLEWCEGLTNVKVNNLKHFAFFESSSNFVIYVPSALETIIIWSCLDWNLYPINNHDFPLLKSLCLYDVQLSEELFGIFSFDSSCLEDLELRNCSGFNHVNIWSRSIKRLTISVGEGQIKTITVNAPGILYFELSFCFSLPSISFATVASREWESNIHMYFELESDDIVVLNEVLMTLRQSRITLTLFCNTMRTQLFEDIIYVYCYEPVVVEHLNLNGLDSDDDDDFVSLLNFLFQILRPRYIYPTEYPNPEPANSLTKFLCKYTLADGEFSRINFWQQGLKELKMELWVQGQWWPVRKLTENSKISNIRFGFEWRESWPCLCR